MLIKEYHIPLPLTVEEYRIAQLYMIQKKSREESEGEGSAVEILENHPYTDGPNGSGQYTHKVYHIGRHVPNWFRSIAPKTALEVHEESWNAYPYTKTILKVPFVEKFSLEIETYFIQDDGSQENMFKLSPSELRSRELDVIDMVNDNLSGSDYKEEEDPSSYVSQKTGRGSLGTDWISKPPDGVIMCAYKLIKVEFRYWGLQSKIERFIHDYGLRRVMLRAHRQAWAWQDEWVGLTMDDVRRLERETQFILQKKLGRLPADAVYQEEEEEKDEIEEEKSAVSLISEELDSNSNQTADDEMSSSTLDVEPPTRKTHSSAKPPEHQRAVRRIASIPLENSHDDRSKDGGRKSQGSWRSRRGDRGSIRSGYSRRLSDTSLRTTSRGSFDSTPRNSDPHVKNKSATLDVYSKRHSVLQSSRPYESDEESMYSARPEWAFDQIAMLSDESDSEFFDAKEKITDDEDECSAEEDEKEVVPTSPRISTTQIQSEPKPPDIYTPLKSLDLMTRLSVSSGALPGSEERHVRGQSSPHPWSTGKARSLDYSGDELGTPSVPELSSPRPGPSTVDILFLVFHGGSALDARKDQIGKAIDFQTLTDNFKSIIELHFQSALGRVALRIVPCVNVCSEALQLLSQVNPTPAVTQSAINGGMLPGPQEDTHRRGSTQSFLETLRDCPCHVPVGAVPLLASEFHGYTESLASVTATANKVYQKFLTSSEGENFNGQVCLLADCMGSMIAYDILASTHSPPTLHSSPCNSPSPKATRKRTSSHNAGRGLDARAQPTSLQECTNGTKPRPLTMVDDLSYLHGSTSSLSSSSTSINVIDSDESTGNSGLVFEVSHFFAFGSPLGLVLGSRRSKSKREALEPPPLPHCTAFYNLFYGIDPMASRVEPLLDSRFSEIVPVSVPPYRLYPSGVAKTNSLKETVVQHPHLLGAQSLSASRWDEASLDRKKAASSECLFSPSQSGFPSTPKDNSVKAVKPFSVWWSLNHTDASRIDYSLESPQCADKFNLLPQAAFSHVIHSRYWEAKELVSFMLRQVLRHDTVSLKQTTNDKELIPFIPEQSVSVWNKRTTAMKIKRLSPNHRVSDVIAVEAGPMPSFTARFQYGPLAMTSLTKEEVEVYLLLQRPKPKWETFGSGLTDKHGKLVFTLPEEKRLSAGVYPVKFLVKGDHTTATCNLFIVPPHTEAVVFSVDGALASNFSLSAKDMKLKHGAVEAARCWQEKGYLLIYITGRPLMQKEHILSFLGAHRFPLGLVACADSLSPDSQTFKTMYLARLIKEAKIIIHVAYGSQRHLAGYKELGLQSDQIYIHGSRRTSKSLRSVNSPSCQYLMDGFTNHLATIDPRKASYDARKLMGDICFVLPGIPKSENSKRKSTRKGYQRSDSRASKRTPQSERAVSLSLDRSRLFVNAETTV